MRIRLLLTILAYSFVVSCKKTSSGPETYHFNATIDGQAQTFTNPVAVTWGISVNVTEDNFEGFTQAYTANPTLRLMWTNTSPGTSLGVGTWSDTSKNYNISGSYLVTPYEGYGAGTNLAATADTSGVKITNHLKIIITSMDGTSVRGTFSGDFYYLNEPFAAKKTITGEFWLPWK